MDRINLRADLRMSLGVSKSFGSSVAIILYQVFVSPSPAVKVDLPSGLATSVIVVGVVNAGTGPFTYKWTYMSGDSFTINTPLSSSTSFTTSGTAGQLKSGVYHLTVTDTGNSNAQTSVDVSVRFTFAGSPL